MNSSETIWNNAQELLKKKMNPVSFSTWIQKIRPVSLENGVLTLATSTEMEKKTLKKVYENTISEAVNLCSDTQLTIRFLLFSEVDETQAKASSSKLQAPMLNPNYTFDTFVVGDSNQFAHAAALAVAENPSNAYNPLFIYGGSGLGKTHLMHAIGHFVYSNNNKAKILYVTSEAFTNELIQMLHEKRPEKFRDKYRSVDILMIDDIQFIVGKESTQAEIFHTFNELYAANKQIVLTSDKPPKDIPGIESRLTSRFECGLIADVQTPNYETRAAILRKKADSEGLIVENEVLYYIAEKVESNIRELEGALNRVLAHAKLMNCSVDVKLAETVLADIIQSSMEGSRISAQIIIQATSEYYRLSVDDIIGKKRDKRVALARQVCMYLCRKLLGSSFEDIGAAAGGKHYSTVMYACDKIENDIKDIQSVRLAVEDIEYRLLKKDR